jgi:hypothetical protein
MQRATIVFHALVLLAVSSIAYPAAAGVEDEIERAAKSYDRAIAANDAEMLGALLDDQGHFVDEQGNEHDRAGHIASFFAERRWDFAESSHRKIRVLSDTVAIETGIFRGVGTFERVPFQIHVRYMDVWIKQDGRWVVTEEWATFTDQEATSTAKTDSLNTDGKAERIANLPLTMVLGQRSTKSVPGTQDALLITADDITRGQVLITLVGKDGTSLFGPLSMRPGVLKSFQFADATYSVKIDEMHNALIGDDFVSVIIADPTTHTEDEKIELLIAAIEDLKGAVFLRNSREYTTTEAATHLRRKLIVDRDEIDSAREFIDHIAAKSSITGDPYIIRLPGGKEIETRVYLNAELKKLESGR